MGRAVALTVLALAPLTACEKLLGLEPLPDSPTYPSHVINDPDGDFDQDDDSNATDLCPLFDHNVIGSTTDRDHDGVGDACDPNPDTPGDCLVLFDDFQHETAPDPRWLGNPGALALGAQSGLIYIAFDQTDDELVTMTVPLDLDAVTVFGYVQSGDQAATPPYDRGAVEVFVDMSPLSPPADGQPCAFESTGPNTATLEQLHVSGGNDSVISSTSIGPERVGTQTNFELYWPDARNLPVGMQPSGCRAHLSDSSIMMDDAATVAAPMPPSHLFAIRGIGVGLFITAVAGWGHSCR